MMDTEATDIPVLADLITLETNLIEIYVCSRALKGLGDTVDVGWKSPPKFLSLFPVGLHQDTYECIYRDLSLTFDLANDAQRVTQRRLLTDAAMGRFFVANLHEDVLPVHRFPCIPPTHKRKTSKVTHRINNRLSLVHENQDAGANVVYFTYHHASNQDMKQMQMDLQKTIFKLLASTS